MSGEARPPSDWLAVPAPEAARRLLGCLILRDDVVVRITEVEAYGGPEDSASHCRMGRTPRNAAMWGAPGRAYVYLCYGIHMMLNVVCAQAGQGSAVLVRGVEVVKGDAVVAARRGGRLGPGRLAGPGKVGAALDIDVSWTGHPLLQPGGLELRRGPAPRRVLVGPRIGIDFAAEADRAAPWRLADGDSRQVSQPRRLRPAGPTPGP